MTKQLSIPSLEEYNYLTYWYIFGQQSEGTINAFLGLYTNQPKAEIEIKLLKAWLEVNNLLENDEVNQLYIDWRKDSNSITEGIYNKEFKRDRQKILEMVALGEELLDILVSNYKSMERRLLAQQQQNQSPKPTKHRKSTKQHV